MDEAERRRFVREASRALDHIEDGLASLEHEDLDVELAGDVLTLAFSDGTRFIINAHSAAGQIWLAAGTNAWHFDFVPAQERWIAAKNGDELMSTVGRVVGDRLGTGVRL